jgi:F0F1-type ATP synthase assembly protein I
MAMLFNCGRPAMQIGPTGSRELGRYFALSQIGMEMVAPIGLGLVLDYWLGWSPWCAVIGAVLGFVGGLAHLIILVNRPKEKEDPSSAGDKK